MTLRLRLTALYSLLFGGCGALLLFITSWIVHRQVERTIPAGLLATRSTKPGSWWLKPL